MIEGLFIVLEGVDGAGTTTHARRLAEALSARGLPVHVTHEPSDGPVGSLVRQVLTGRLVVPGMGGGRAPGWRTMALLFAADRLDHMEAEIQPNLRDGVTVICDRYDHSSVAYQAAGGSGDEDAIGWVRGLNLHAPRPDLVVVLDVPAEVAARRRRERSGGRELYDDEELQRDLVHFYRDVERHFPEDRIVHVDADRSIEEVAADVLAAVDAVRAEGASRRG